MTRGPDEELKQDGCKRNSFGRETVMSAATIIGHRLGGNDAGGLELLKTIGKNVGRNSLAGSLKFTESAVATHHHVADHDQ